ncbi:hypothetical protein OG323_06315 [Streptomyces cyaneofuscatus]|uniref:hypothetical protein n=1 Tax=Streptomyces cyaneofuscatus TaxID=66883 RepID=UPI003865DA1D|nr:hypothetical protein OG323_06315 [Streptomyces cyaneofuscatus]
MRDPETDRLLTDVRAAVIAAREGGAAIRACIWDATAAAVDQKMQTYSPEARSIADAACSAVEPPSAAPAKGPQVPPPFLAKLLWSAANWIASRQK